MVLYFCSNAVFYRAYCFRVQALSPAGNLCACFVDCTLFCCRRLFAPCVCLFCFVKLFQFTTTSVLIRLVHTYRQQRVVVVVNVGFVFLHVVLQSVVDTPDPLRVFAVVYEAPRCCAPFPPPPRKPRISIPRKSTRALCSAACHCFILCTRRQVC